MEDGPFQRRWLPFQRVEFLLQRFVFGINLNLLHAGFSLTEIVGRIGFDVRRNRQSHAPKVHPSAIRVLLFGLKDFSRDFHCLRFVAEHLIRATNRRQQNEQ